MRRLALLCCCGVVAAAGCQRPDDQRTDTISADQVRQAREQLSPAVVAQLDSGNLAYRARNYEEARRHYQAAAQADPEAGAAWFGVYMAEQALGNLAAADSAMRRAQQLQPGASLIHPGPADTVTLPPGHP